MQPQDWALLDELAPGTSQNRDSAHWLKRSSDIIAISTQGREVYPVMDHSCGQGSTLYDLDGNRYLDMTSGVAVRALGARYQPLLDFELRTQSVVEEFPGQDFDHLPQVLLGERLAQLTPGDFDKQVFFTTSGARAIETAVKAAVDNTHRTRFVAFRPAFHGRTGYAMALSASKAVHREHYPISLQVTRVPYAYCYRCPYNLQAEDCDGYCADQVKVALEREGGDIAGIMVEPVSGEGGMVPSHPKFLPRLREIADEYGAWLIVDEVQSGMGRTGKWWATEHYNVIPDAVCTAKALGAGWPLGATIGRSPLFSKASRHSETFSAEPRQALLSLFMLKELEQGGFIENAARMGKLFLAELKKIEASYDIIGETRGLGLMIGIEIVESKASKKSSPTLREEIIREAIHGERLMLLGAGENSIRLLPALNVTEEEAYDCLRRLDRAIAKVAQRHAERTVFARS